MKHSIKQILFDAWDYCDEKDKSTEFMLQYMSDIANVDYDVVVDFISDDKINAERKARWEKLNPGKKF